MLHQEMTERDLRLSVRDVLILAIVKDGYNSQKEVNDQLAYTIGMDRYDTGSISRAFRRLMAHRLIRYMSSSETDIERERLFQGSKTFYVITNQGRKMLDDLHTMTG